eukprot:TRINITY_DN1802_c0_g1_i1.p1 TRINITY_DN1802_c0_g1~~TRINITY_DN1802_c0_g1_i1.p1  ORF type:complete len:122 (+),score=1.53 TRINITY_DN1802_c0_g1_i1:76-441(+)
MDSPSVYWSLEQRLGNSVALGLRANFKSDQYDNSHLCKHTTMYHYSRNPTLNVAEQPHCVRASLDSISNRRRCGSAPSSSGSVNVAKSSSDTRDRHNYSALKGPAAEILNSVFFCTSRTDT